VAICTVLASSIASIAAETKGKLKVRQIQPGSLKAQAAPNLKAGIVFPSGAFDLSTQPDAMILGNLGYPTGIGFIHGPMTYYGEYTDPDTGVKGWLYSLQIGGNKRFFLVSESGIPGLGESQRWIFEYDDQGTPLTSFQGTFVPKP